MRLNAESRRADPGRAAWVAGLPATVAGLCRRWSLQLGAPFAPGGSAAWVAPARDAAGRDLVLKVGWAHPEALHEAAALAVWDGAGAVRCHATVSEGSTIALLLQRCRPGTALRDLRAEPECDLVVAGLLRRLWCEPGPAHPFRPLADMCRLWVEEFQLAGTRPGPGHDPGLVRDGAALFTALPATAARHVLLCTDLHAGNILAASDGGPWLAIDPKPYVGDPAYDVVQHLLNCTERLRADPVGLTSRLAGLLDLDAERVRQWVFARCALESARDLELAAIARALAAGARRPTSR